MQRFLDKLETSTGVRYGLDKEYFILGRLKDQLSRFDCADASALMEVACRQTERKWCEDFFSELLIHETYFFREEDTFQTLHDLILQSARERACKEPFRAWSASCSSGQEVISLAIVLSEIQAACPSFGFDILGSDLNAACIEKALKGRYSDFELRRGLSEQQIARYFKRVEGGAELHPTLRKFMNFERINLMGPIAFKEKFDVVFLRNTLIYYRDDVRQILMKKILASAKPGAFIVVGSAEKIPRSFLEADLVPVFKGIYRVAAR
jgi:chemotaxis protein methyltransferase CheR